MIRVNVVILVRLVIGVNLMATLVITICHFVIFSTKFDTKKCVKCNTDFATKRQKFNNFFGVVSSGLL